MPTITAIDQSERGSRCQIFVDGEPWLAVEREAVLSCGLRRGDEATPALAARLQQLDREQRAYAAALTFLSYRPRAAGELRDRLRRKGFAVEAINAALQRLLQAGLVNDDEFAAQWVAERGSGAAARGSRALRIELRTRGVEAHAIDAALTGGDDLARAREAAAPRLGRLAALPYPEFARRLGSFLQRRGYSYDVVGTVVRESWYALQTDDQDDGGHSWT